MWPVLLLSMLALGPPSVACRRQLLVTVISDEPQTSVPFALPLSQAGSPDLDIDQPPLVSPCLIKWWQVVSNFRARLCAMHQKRIMGRPPPALPPPPPPRTHSSAHPLLQVRRVTGFQPEGVHLAHWGSNSMLVSWQTGAPLIADNADPPQPYDAASVGSVVRFGTSSGQLSMTAQDDSNNRVYSYTYGPGLVAQYLQLRPGLELAGVTVARRPPPSADAAPSASCCRFWQHDVPEPHPAPRVAVRPAASHHLLLPCG